jgi:hypothetical protein
MGVDKSAKARALTALRRAGLIITRQEPGETAVVAIVPHKGGKG